MSLFKYIQNSLFKMLIQYNLNDLSDLNKSNTCYTLKKVQNTFSCPDIVYNTFFSL